MRFYSLSAALLFASLPLAAQEVPSLDRASQITAQPVSVITPTKVTLSKKEAHGVALASEWMENPDKPRMDDDGSVRYLFGATLPTLVCAPMQICAIRLQPGEVVNKIDAADAVRWKFSPSVTGVGAGAITEIIVKVKDAGLEQSIRVATDRRAYTIKLVSTTKSWMPALSFDYPDEVQSEWDAYAAERRKTLTATTLPTGQTFGELSFNYRISGDKPAWMPLRVYSDGAKTYIQFPPSIGASEAPALVALDGGDEQIVNYRVQGDRYVVDKVIERAALIAGVGRKQERVTITRAERR